MNGKNGLHELEQGEDITIDKLVNCNGDWFLVYIFNNYGSNLVMLLPMTELDHLSPESYINSACMHLCQGTFEEQMMVEQWFKDYPDTPFMAYSYELYGLNHAIEKINENLRKYNGDWHKFTEDVVKFNEWRNVVYYVVNTEYADVDVCDHGYKYLIQKAKDFVDLK